MTRIWRINADFLIIYSSNLTTREAKWFRWISRRKSAVIHLKNANTVLAMLLFLVNFEKNWLKTWTHMKIAMPLYLFWTPPLHRRAYKRFRCWISGVNAQNSRRTVDAGTKSLDCCNPIKLIDPTGMALMIMCIRIQKVMRLGEQKIKLNKL